MTAGDVISVVLAVIGIPLWVYGVVHVAGHTDAEFKLAGVAPRTFWLVTVVLLGPVWAAAYLWYAGRRVVRISA